ncbi:MAG: O-antigen/teichoic acid export membrane protein [Parvicella sp.]|jgi:O-antigen/teichoic acid export membrane protein
MIIDSPSKLNNKSRLRFLFKDSVLYGGAVALSKAFGLITFPILASYFSIVDFGKIDYFVVLAGFMAVMFIFGQDSAVARFFYENEDEKERSQLISQSILFQLLLLLVVLPILWFSSGWWVKFLVDTNESGRLVKIVILQVPFLLLINFSQNLLKWTFLRTKFLTISLGFTVTKLSLLLVAIYGFQIEVEGVLIVNLISSAVFGILGLYFVRNWLVFPNNFQKIRDMLFYAIPFGMIGLMGAFSPILERSLTAQLLGVENLGLYAAGIKITMIIAFIIGAFQTAWGPFSLSIYKEQDAGYTYNWVLKIFSLAICVLLLLISLFSHSLINILAPEEYAGASFVVFPLAFGLAVKSISWITEIGIGISKKSYLNLYGYVAFVGATIGGIFMLTPVLGLIGVALGVLIGHIVKAVISSSLAQRAFPLPWQYTPVIILVISTLAVGLFGVWGDWKWGFQASFVINVFGILGIMILGWALLFSRLERNSLIQLVKNKYRSIVKNN